MSTEETTTEDQPQFLTAFTVVVTWDGGLVLVTDTPEITRFRDPTPVDVEAASLRLAAEMSRTIVVGQIQSALTPPAPETPAKRVSKKLAEQKSKG